MNYRTAMDLLPSQQVVFEEIVEDSLMKWDTSSTVLKKPFAIRGGFTNGLGLVRVFMVHVYRSAAITTERSSRHGRMYASQWSISVQYCYDAEKRSELCSRLIRSDSSVSLTPIKTLRYLLSVH